MQTNASFVRIPIAVAAAALFVVACGAPKTQTPSPAPGTTGTGGNGSGGSGGSGGGGTVGTGGSGGGGGGGGTGGAGGGGGTTASGTGCAAYVACLKAAASEADATACDNKASASGKMILGAVDTCVASYCEGGSGGGKARCKADANGLPVNLDGSAAFDQTTGAPSGDCGTCLVDGEASLFGDTCTPANDPACTTTACTQQISACTGDKS